MLMEDGGFVVAVVVVALVVDARIFHKVRCGVDVALATVLVAVPQVVGYSLLLSPMHYHYPPGLVVAASLDKPLVGLVVLVVVLYLLFVVLLVVL